MSGSTAVAMAKPRRARMPELYVLSGASMNAPMSANSMTSGVICCIVSWGMPIRAPASAMLSRPTAPGRSPPARLSRVEMWPLTSTTPSDGVMMPGEHQQQRALARAVRPDDPERLAPPHRERDVPQRPEPCRSRFSRRSRFTKSCGAWSSW